MDVLIVHRYDSFMEPISIFVVVVL